MAWKPQIRVFSQDVIDELRERGPDVDAGRDLFPLIAKEALLAYYTRLAELDGDRAPTGTRRCGRSRS